MRVFLSEALVLWSEPHVPFLGAEGRRPRVDILRDKPSFPGALLQLSPHACSSFSIVLTTTSPLFRRLAVVQCVAVLWNSYLSWKAHRL